MPTPSTSITRLADRLTALTPGEPDRYGVSDLSATAPLLAPPGWLPVNDPAAVIAAMMSGSGLHLRISPAVIGARLIGSLGYAAVGRPAVALAVAGQVYDTGPDSLLLALDATGLVERIAVRNPVLTGWQAEPPADSEPSTTLLPDLDALLGWTAERALATLNPLLEELHRVTRYGRIPMWNLVADTILGPAAAAAGLAGFGQQTGHQLGSALIDRMVAGGAPIRRRGTLQLDPIQLDPIQLGPIRLGPIRGACCLHYRQVQEHCTSCPLTSLGPPKSDLDLR